MLLTRFRLAWAAGQRASRAQRAAVVPVRPCGGNRSVRPRQLVKRGVAAAEVETSFSSLLDDEDELLEDEDAALESEKEIDESLMIANLGLCAETMDAMAARGIFSLFPVQAQVFEPIMSGRDVVCRAKTGSGKTLAFALPVVENLLEEDRKSRPLKGRAPRCVVLAPTRELANQVAREFETVCPALRVDSFYGGVSIGPQMRSLERGVDVVVGTPGRVIDLVERGALRLNAVQFAILDEADSMLDMGFEQDMETILGAMPAGVDRQTLLFSATLPKWVKSVAKRYQQNPLTIDLVGEENTGRLADTIRLLVQQVDMSQKVSALQGLLSVYGNMAGGGKSIIFVNTKVRADEVNMAVNEFTSCDALHGDIGQAQREKALAMFREGKYSCLVATDVAARGLDIPSVDLVVHYDLPQDNEAFLHRSGRTGRAGKTGTAVVLFTEREARSLGMVLRATKVSNAELVGAPDPKEVMRTASRSVLGKLDKVDAGVVEFFEPAAERLLASEKPSRVLAAALAALAGFRNVPQPRSLLTYEAGFLTMRLLTTKGMVVDGIRSLGTALRQLAAAAPPNTSAPLAGGGSIKLVDIDRLIGRIRPVEGAAGEAAEAGMSGLAFDLPTGVAEVLIQHCTEAAAQRGWLLDSPRSLALEVDALMSGRSGGGGGGSRFGRDGGDRGGYGRGGDRGGYSRGGDRGDRGGYGGRSEGRFGRSDRGGGGGERGGYGGGGGGRSYDRSDRAGGERGDRAGTGASGGGRFARDGGSGRSDRAGGERGYGAASGSSFDEWSSWGGGGGSSRSRDRDGGSRGSGGGFAREPSWQGGAGSGAGRRAADSKPSGGAAAPAERAPPSKGRRLDDPSGPDSWGQW